MVREEGGQVRRYSHLGTGNYHTGTARFYEDVGVLTSDDDVCADVASIFNALTGGRLSGDQRRILVAPVTMRRQLNSLIRREAEHARNGRICGIEAKLNQLQDPNVIRELYRAGRAGVPIRLNVPRSLLSTALALPDSRRTLESMASSVASSNTAVSTLSEMVVIPTTTSVRRTG